MYFPGTMISGSNGSCTKGRSGPKTGRFSMVSGYLHGHMIPSPALAGHLIVIGHHHPLLSLRDEVGCALQSPAYLRAGIDTGALGMVLLVNEA